MKFGPLQGSTQPGGGEYVKNCGKSLCMKIISNSTVNQRVKAKNKRGEAVPHIEADCLVKGNKGGDISVCLKSDNE